MSKTLSWEVDASEAIAFVDKMIRNAASYREPLSEAAKFLRVEFQENFNSQGAMVGGWAPLSPRTSAWRVKHGYPATHPILVNEGGLRTAVKMMGEDVGAKEAHLSVNHPLAPYHQYGSTKVHLPQRKILFEPKGFADLLARRLTAHIIPNRMTAELRRLFQR